MVVVVVVVGGSGGGGMDDVQMMLLSLYSSNEKSDGNGLDLSPVVHSALKNNNAVWKDARCIISGWPPFFRCCYSTTYSSS